MKRVDKPWGHEIWWSVTEKYAGKILFVKKGHSLSYQYHEVKDESMYLRSGRMEVELEEGDKPVKKFTLSPGEAIRILPLTRHKMTAVEDSEIFEVSTPEVDDIVRLGDEYGRA